MPRQLKDARLQNRTSRAKLKARPKPYYRELDPGIHLGYRKGKTGGKWVVRAYVGDAAYKTATLTTADDNADPDGKLVLDYGQAQKLGRKKARELIAAAQGQHIGPYTVRAAFDDYLDHLAVENRDSKETRRRINRICDEFGGVQLDKLKKDQIKAWLRRFVKTPPKYRGGKARPVDMSDPEVQRRRKDTANRHLTDLKAALNHAYNEGKIQSDAAWRMVKPFRAVSGARVRYLSMDEIKRLLNAARPDLRALINGAILTGARVSDLVEMRVGDFMPDASAVQVGNRKARHAGKSAFPCYLSPEGMKFFQRHTAGWEPGEFMFTREDGKQWTRHDTRRPLAEANAAAKIKPPAAFHVLRHTYASHAVMAGVPLMVVAENLGHSDTRMVEKHYGHLAPSFARDAIAKGLPTWGVEVDETVTALKAG